MEANTTNYSSNIEEDIKNICEEPFSEDNENDYSNDDHTHKISNAESSELSEEEISNKLKKNKIYLKLHEGVEKLEQNSEPSSGSELDGETIKEPKKKRSKKSTMEKFSEKNDNKGERARSQCSICGKLYVNILELKISV